MPDWSIDHISAVTLAVRDMAESVVFYERLGLHVSYGGPHAAFTTMRAARSIINLRHTPQGAGNPRVDRIIFLFSMIKHACRAIPTFVARMSQTTPALCRTFYDMHALWDAPHAGSPRGPLAGLVPGIHRGGVSTTECDEGKRMSQCDDHFCRHPTSSSA